MGYLYIAFFAAFLYLAPVILLCVKVANKTTAKTGWAIAFGLLIFPVILLVIGGVIDANGAAS
ncbi:hypothetical protein [Streptomyces halobius]|uniref:Cardiolipin synthase N-terminal domain-containing protein n=1 Tax=Streptomyces halobius TaxID=2879846 RepID=A0ABY4MF16_9ACTN|nr:hypothetical protein [Streptomyces halobius]UQA95698.1 hypothetical protein K9S39_30975 [Streptomyces halobius]